MKRLKKRPGHKQTPNASTQRKARRNHMREIRTQAREQQHVKRRLTFTSEDKLISTAISRFKKKASQQPIYACTVCHRLLYREGVKIFNIDNYSNVKTTIKNLVFKPSFSITAPDNNRYICFTCSRHINNNKIPPQSKANGLELAPVPEELQDLHHLEQRLIAQRIPFIKMISLPKGKQRAVHGPAVNIPASLEPVCDLLPRLPTSAHLIPLKLKRKLQYKTAYLNNYIRPAKVMSALQFLKKNNTLYENVNINDNWTQTWETEDPDLWEALKNNLATPPTDGNSNVMTVLPTQCTQEQMDETPAPSQSTTQCTGHMVEAQGLPPSTARYETQINEDTEQRKRHELSEHSLPQDASDNCIPMHDSATPESSNNQNSLYETAQTLTPPSSAARCETQINKDSSMHYQSTNQEQLELPLPQHATLNCTPVQNIAPPESSNDLHSLYEAADIRGFRVLDVSNNGDCMFEAILSQLQLENGTKDIKTFRMILAHYMKRNHQRYKDFVSTGVGNFSNDTAPRTSFDDTLDEMRTIYPRLARELLWNRYLERLQKSAWGDDLVLQAIADKYAVIIQILQPTNNSILGEVITKAPKVNTTMTMDQLQNIWIGFIPQKHYVSLIKKAQTIRTSNKTTSQTALSTPSQTTSSNSEEETQQEKEHAEDQAELDRSIKLTGIPYDSCLQHEATEGADDIYSVAPGENKKPLPILTDHYFEELANPEKYPYGQGGFLNSSRPVPISISKYANARLLDQDGRFSKDPDYFLTLQYAVEHKAVQDKLNIAIRQVNGRQYEGEDINAGHLKNPNVLNNLIHQDKAYKFLKNIRGSPPYWQNMFHETLAMIRQRGIPTWFFTLSAADLQWPEVIQGIAAQYGTFYTEEEVQNLSWETKSRWLRTNPITAARNFQHRLDAFFSEFIKSPAAPIGPVTDFVIRIEFQARGSPHAHTLLWVKDAPKLTYSTDEEVTSFIDKYSTCALPNESTELYTLVNKLQRHCCSSRCRRYGHCRFNFPKPPTPQTIIGKEPKEDTSTEQLKKAQETTLLVKTVLQDPATPPNISISDLLQKAGVTEEQYIQALSINKKGLTVHLKRTPEARNINTYNEHVLLSWQANHDLQFVINAYAAVMYVASYVLKAEKGMGELLKQAAKQAQDQEIRQQLKKVGSVFLTHREISAQEAVYRVLSIPLRKSSRAVKYINTNPKKDRVSILLPHDKIQSMDDDDEEVFASSIIEKYASRPTELDDKCLAWFAANYDRCSPTTNSTQNRQAPMQSLESDVVPNLTEDLNEQECQVITLQNNLGKMRKRKTEAIIRWHKFNKEKEPEKYYRAKLFLFMPWRNEEEIIGNYTSMEDRYTEECTAVQQNEQQYTYNEGELNEAYQQLEENGPPENAWEAMAPNMAAQVNDEENEGSTEERHIDDNDLQAQLTLPQRQSAAADQSNRSLLFTKEKNKTLMSTSEYNASMRSLNKKQRDIINYHRQWCKDAIIAHKANKPVQPYQLFLSGPGGVGKSFIIKLLYNDTVKLLRNIDFITADDIPILLTASTGVAAFNINGMTVHSAFALTDRKKTNGEYLPLGADTANTLQTQLEQLHVVIIDEVSMIGANTLTKIHHRLQEIKKLKYADTRFGNVTIIAVGDLYQLPPFKDKKLYATPGTKNNPTMNTLHGSIWQECFKYHELDDIVRQQDPVFVEILNNIRHGVPDERLQQCVISTNDPNYKKHALHVFGTNALCLHHNNNMLYNLSTNKYIIEAEDTKKDTITEQVSLDLSKETRSKTGGLESTLIVAEGAKIKLTSNIDVSDGLANGARGEIVHIVIINNKVHAVLVQFDNPNIGEAAKSKSQYKTRFPNAVPIYRFGANFSIGKGLNISRSQFPITLAWASTIHTVQGLTVDEIVVHMGAIFDYGQAYVAFSRVRTIQGLQILEEYLPKKIRSDPHLQEEVLRLQANTIPIQELQIPQMQTNWLRIAHLNVRGYLTHLQDIQHHKELCSMDVICITETHFHPTNTIPRSNQPQPNYEIFRKDRTSTNTSCKGGVAIFAHPRHMPQQNKPSSINSLEYVAITLTESGQQMQIIAIYRPQTTSIQQFLHDLDKLMLDLLVSTTSTIIVGDFNEDLLKSKNHPIKDHLQKYGFNQYVTKPTTDYGSLLDHIYHNMEPTSQHYEIQDTYYSDHDVTFAAFQF